MSETAVATRGLSGRKKAIARAVKIAGSQSLLGKACGVTQTTIWRALGSGWVNAELANAIEAATAGQVSKSILRPDLWPPPSRKSTRKPLRRPRKASPPEHLQA